MAKKGKSRQYNHDLRLERASQNLQSLEAEVQRWLGSHPYGFIQEFDAQRSEYAIRVVAFERPPANVSFLISECLHNLRSALDNLVYDLALAHNGGNPLPTKVEEKVAFPIFDSEKGFKGKGAWRIRGTIDPGAETDIKGLQPYVRGNSRLLWELNELSRVDKHRLLHVTLLGMHEGAFNGADPNTRADSVTFAGGAIEVAKRGTTVGGTELLRYRATPIDPSHKMDVYFQFGFGVAFGQDSPVSAGESVLGRLGSLREYIIHRVLPPLVPYLS
jgi:hypothetical protein